MRVAVAVVDEARAAVEVCRDQSLGGGAAGAGVAGGARRADAVGMGAGCAVSVVRRDGTLAAERVVPAEVRAMLSLLMIPS